MHFKRLELFGFKSFADRTVFHFEPGVTAIVGPNGCGKTNCVDAIRWVLGEQNSRELRGTKMEDVIFNGTGAIPPLGFAEVSLTLSNEDHHLPIEYNEVTVTRRLYRSGESEYLLNKLPVRLKDIQELFMGTGIGVESYSIIGQGQIDLILSARPEDRRTVFEEASGITKYKAKKREALRRLEETEQNLLRVSDIVTEVQRQLRSIERHVEKARKYQERFAELKAWELEAASIEQAQLGTQREALATQQQEVAARIRTAVATWEEVKHRADELQQQREALLHQLSDRHTARAAVQGTLERHQREIQLKTQWQQELAQQQTTLTAECEAFRARLVQLTTQLADTQRSLEALVEEVAQYDRRVWSAEAKLTVIERTITATHTALQTTKQALLDQNATLSHLKSELAKVSATAQAQQARLRRLRADQQELVTQADTLDGKHRHLRTQQGTLTAHLTEHAQRVTELQAQRDELNQRLQQTEQRVVEVRHTTAQQAATCQLLEQLWRRHEGFSDGVKALLDAQHPDIVGVVADLLDVEPGWEVAIEAALGERAQAVVVEQTASAWQLLRWLRDRNAGRAQLLPLDHTVPPVAEATTSAITGLVGPATRVVKIREPRIATQIRLWLAQVWLVEQLEALPQWPQDVACVVDRAGNVWQAGVLTGGSHAETTGVVGRRARLETVQRQLATLQAQQTAEEHTLATLTSSRTALTAELEQRSAALQTLQREQATQQVLVSQTAEELQRVTTERDVVRVELSEVETEYRETAQAQQQLAEQITAAEAELQGAEAALATHQATLTQHTEAREALVVDLTRLKANRETVTARRQTLEETLRDLQARLTESQQALATRESQLREGQTRIEHLTRELEDHRHAITQLEGDVRTVAAAIEDVTHQGDALKQQLASLHPDLTREQQAVDALRDQQRQAEVALAEMQFKAQALRERMRDHYQCDIPALEGPPSAERLATLQPMLATQRERLDAMGPVSLGSLADQEELSQRLTFLTTQQQDLTQAQGSLKETIAKTNRETRKAFLEIFARIQTEFQLFFKLLFGGGEAELILLDPEQVLDCGIEINAQPPGKKLQSIGLLSGGEQAMTAIALLFALFKVRPSPFCILDEIDAPLDESNVDRFTKGLGGFTQLSQFIIITHNKKTITRADVMYGVTMEEVGVSKIVSVKFAEDTSPAAASSAK